LALSTQNRTVHLLLLVSLTVATIGFWNIHSPWGIYEDWIKVQNNAVIAQTGHISMTLGNYLTFPSSFVADQTLSFFLGYNPYFVAPFVTISTITFVIILYLLASKVLHNSSSAFFAVTLYMIGDVVINGVHYHPDYMSLCIAASLMYIIIGSSARTDRASLVTSMILMGAVITEAPSATLVTLVFIATAVLAARRYVNRRPGAFNSYFLVTVVASFVAWIIYWASLFERGVIIGIISLSSSFESLFNVSTSVIGSHSRGGSFVGPLEIFWIGVLIGLPIFIIIWHTISGDFSRINGWATFVYFSAGVAGVLAIAIQPGNFFLPLLYMPIGGSLIVMTFVKDRKYIKVLIALAIITLALPSFYAANSRIISGATQPQFYYAGSFVASYYPSSSPVFGDSLVQWFNPTAVWYSAVYLVGPANNFAAAEGNIQSYLADSQSHGSIFILQPTLFDNYYHLYGVSEGSTIQTLVDHDLSGNDLVLSDGFDSGYLPPS
nr:hypothetical protein [Nitrososphaerota archaeon]